MRPPATFLRRRVVAFVVSTATLIVTLVAFTGFQSTSTAYLGGQLRAGGPRAAGSGSAGSVITLQPTPVPTAATVPPSTSTTTTTEAPLPTLPPRSTAPVSSATVTTSTKPVLGPPRPNAALDDPSLAPVCDSVVPPEAAGEGTEGTSGPAVPTPVGSTTSVLPPSRSSLPAPTSGTAPVASAGTAAVAPSGASPVSPSGTACRIVAYYGNPLSTRMGVLGQYPAAEMLKRLAAQVEVWRKADPGIRTQCALELIAVTAQGGPGAGGLYRARMKPALIDEVITMARSAGCLTILDVQVGASTVADEVAFLLPWLAQPDVHLALDPEWDMPPGVKPGARVGTMDAADINGAIGVLTQLVATGKLAPKLLIVHRFRDFMVTNPTSIKPTSAVRLLVNMDGFGPPKTKLNSYRVAKAGMPTTLTGFKLFYKNDVPIMGPTDVLPLEPVPMFINYQ